MSYIWPFFLIIPVFLLMIFFPLFRHYDQREKTAKLEVKVEHLEKKRGD